MGDRVLRISEYTVLRGPALLSVPVVGDAARATEALERGLWVTEAQSSPGVKVVEMPVAQVLSGDPPDQNGVVRGELLVSVSAGAASRRLRSALVVVIVV